MAAMTASLPAWSAVPLENQLGGATASNAYWNRVHTPRIDMTNIAMTYSGTKTSGKFKAVSTSTQSFRW